jgi:hypothetical protein
MGTNVKGEWLLALSHQHDCLVSSLMGSPRTCGVCAALEPSTNEPAHHAQSDLWPHRISSCTQVLPMATEEVPGPALEREHRP